MVVKTARLLVCGLALSAFTRAATAEPAKLIFTSLSPGGSANSVFFGAWAKKVNAASHGTLNIEVRDGESLANFGNVYERVTNDVVQIGWIIHGIVGNKFPLSDVASLPFLVDDNVGCSVAMWRLYKSGMLDAEYREVVPLWFGCLSTTYLHFAKKPPTTDNLEGLKMRVNNKITGEVIKLMGGTPISLPGGEMYQALQRGTIDGVATAWSAFDPYKLSEVTSFHLEVPMGTTPSMQFMARKKFDALPKAARDAIMENAGEAGSRMMGAYIAGKAKEARDAVAADPAKHTLVKLSSVQLEAWEKRTAPITAEWIKGHPARDKVLVAFKNYYKEVVAGH
jgi:TRAP-type C4-dicarboxylate transport system substrate-binding protein